MSNLLERGRQTFGRESFGLMLLMAALIVIFGLASPRFLTGANFASMGFQAPLLGLLTIAMLAPMISGGFNLAVIYTANISGLTMAWVLLQAGGPEAGGGRSFWGRWPRWSSAPWRVPPWGWSSPISARIRSWSRWP